MGEKYGMHIQYVSDRDMHTVYCCLSALRPVAAPAASSASSGCGSGSGCGCGSSSSSSGGGVSVCPSPVCDRCQREADGSACYSMYWLPLYGVSQYFCMVISGVRCVEIAGSSVHSVN